MKKALYTLLVALFALPMGAQVKYVYTEASDLTLVGKPVKKILKKYGIK